MELQQLIDRQKIIDAINNVAICADLGLWDKMLAEVFAEEVRVDYTSLFGGEVQKLKSADLVAGWKSVLPGFSSTQHLLGNHQITIKGDAARALAYVRAHHYLPNKTGADTWVVGGYYNYELKRAGENWLITSMKLNVLYTEGNQHLLTLAQTAVATE
jgi:hypothetical protein